MTPITFGADRYFSSIAARRGAVLRRQQPALFGQDHPAITPPVGQHAAVIDKVVALLGGKDPRVRFVEGSSQAWSSIENRSSLKSSVV